jgi:hypothetical protein
MASCQSHVCIAREPRRAASSVESIGRKDCDRMVACLGQQATDDYLRGKGLDWHDEGSMNDPNIVVGLHMNIYDRSPNKLNNVSKPPTVGAADQDDASTLSASCIPRVGRLAAAPELFS